MITDLNNDLFLVFDWYCIDNWSFLFDGRWKEVYVIIFDIKDY